ncbi:hypothetical protein PR003_g6372 [Phytophthora rubi]|uniref:Uncharacterized protein n=1 Tax=Phytophthora rubi TaxID=129364 RepID=A0A6A4FSK2_9STRA|nr:hypothetical protein PR003_g6372 [Phytophthora rubi]
MPSDSDYEPDSEGESAEEQMDDYAHEYMEEADDSCVEAPRADGANEAQYDHVKKGEADHVKKGEADDAKQEEAEGSKDAEEESAEVLIDDGAVNTTGAPAHRNADMEHATDGPEKEAALKTPGADHMMVAAGKAGEASTRKRRNVVDAFLESGSELTALTPLEKRYRPSKWSKEREIMAASHKNISVTTESFMSNRSWLEWSSFEHDFDAYLESNYLVYRKRNNVPALRNNRKYADNVADNGGDDGAAVLQVCEHNHYVDEGIYRSVCRGEAVDAKQLGATVDILRSAEVPMRNLAEFLCAETDCDLSNQDVRNYCKARYGGPDTEHKLLRFLDEFMTIPGNYAFVLREYDDVVSGLVLVNEAQREAYRRWGDALLLDWTYNVNNLGFLLGGSFDTYPKIEYGC